MISLALYQPEIPQNAGALIRLCACFDLTLHIIEPCAFIWDDKRLARSSMDYLCPIVRHLSFDHFKEQTKQNRLVLADVKGTEPLWDFKFDKDDILIMGQESNGVPQSVFDSVNTSLFIPQKQGRSLNVATAASMVLSQGLLQLR